jgi:acetolactate synthase-1/2/3 large subunit
MAGAIVYPGKKVVATVSDRGFLYSSMKLETAVRLKLNLTVFVLRDGGYNMVAFQLAGFRSLPSAQGIGVAGLHLRSQGAKARRTF